MRICKYFVIGDRRNSFHNLPDRAKKKLNYLSPGASTEPVDRAQNILRIMPVFHEVYKAWPPELSRPKWSTVSNSLVFRGTDVRNIPVPVCSSDC